MRYPYLPSTVAVGLMLAASVASSQTMPSLWNSTGSGPAYSSGLNYGQSSYGQSGFNQASPALPGASETISVQATAPVGPYSPYASYPVAQAPQSAPGLAGMPQPTFPTPSPSPFAQTSFTQPVASPILESQPPISAPMYTAPPCSSCMSNGVSFACSSGLVGGAELVFLKPQLGDYESLNIDGFHGRFGSNDYEMVPRCWLGYVTASGLGVRARHWRFDHGLDAETARFDDDYGLPTGDEFSMAGRLRIEATDLEVTQQVQMGNWLANFGAGLRYSQIDHDVWMTYREQGQPAVGVSVYDHLTGIGPTVAADFRRPLGDTPISLIGNARGSLLFGDERFTRSADLLNADQFSGRLDATLGVFEVQMGIDWSYALSGGGKFFVQGLFEGQLWTTTAEVGSGELEMLGIGSGDFGLVGFSAGIGICR